MTEVLQVTRSGSTAVVTLNRPQQRNALDLELRAALTEAIPQLRENAEVRAVVITGAGGHFCSGGDIRNMMQSVQRQRDVFEGRERLRKVHRWFEEIVDLEKPVIAAVDGSAFGAGFSLALAADFVFASSRASFGSVFAKMGFVPDLGLMYTLPRRIGLAKAKELVYSARTVGAAEALSIGIVDKMVDGDVIAEAVEFAGRFENAPIDALGLAKSVMNRAFESERHVVLAHEASAQAICRESAFHHEAVRRFVAKEPPLFQWPG